MVVVGGGGWVGGCSNQLPCNPNLGLDWIELGWKLGWVVTNTILIPMLPIVTVTHPNVLYPTFWKCSLLGKFYTNTQVHCYNKQFGLVHFVC